MSTTATADETAPKLQYQTHLRIVALVPPATPLRAVHAYVFDDHVLVEAYDVVTLAMVEAYDATTKAGEYLTFSPDSGRWRKDELSPEVRGIFRCDPEAGGYSGPGLAMVDEDHCVNAGLSPAQPDHPRNIFHPGLVASAIDLPLKPDCFICRADLCRSSHPN